MAQPQRFGRFVIEARIGSGGMGTVFRAHDQKLDRTVALKLLAPEAANDPERKARLVREARLAGSLAHPSIVFVHEVLEEAGSLAIVMEHVDGEPLDRFARQNPPLQQRLAIVEALASALAQAHEHGIVHRDVKPSNVIVPKGGTTPAKLVDFGIAKALSPQATMVTKEALILGTPRYMAPEQRVSSDVDARADQYAWAVVAYELLAGIHPDDAATDGRPAPLAWHCEAVGEEAAAVIHRAMSKEADARFASMSDVLAAWQMTRPEPTPKASRARSDGSRSARIFLLGLGATVLVIAGAGAALFGRARTPAPVPSSSARTETTSLPAPAPESEPEPAATETGVADAAIDASHAKPHLPRIVLYGTWFAKPAESRAKLNRAMPALIACFAGKHLGAPGSHVGVHLKVEQNGTVTDSWAGEGCYGAKCAGAKTWMPEGSKQCVLKAFQPIKDVGPLDDDHSSGVWVDLDVFP